MNQLVIMQNQQAVTTSLKIAEVFGKEHRSVLKAIDDLMGSAQNCATLFKEAEYTHPQNNQNYRMFYMGRDGFTLLAMGFTGKDAVQFKLDYIQAFNQMETTIKHIQVPTNPMDALKLMFQVQEEAVKRTDDIDKRVVELEENVSLTPGEYNAIGRRVSERIKRICSDRKWFLNSEQNKILFRALNTDIAIVAGVRTRSQIKQKSFDVVYDLVSIWEPSQATISQIKNAQEAL